ncbi:hypothetical protein ST47_g8115 [Ascochyta rabiei]|uniref:Uncharacterized protein n=1 Tax=Didymella rabiei TaxID=5454 RepID=A0A162ZPS4_DIDRA|nr:hypothetical protein ST47_g8115 [Ascochyta rabiei]
MAPDSHKPTLLVAEVTTIPTSPTENAPITTSTVPNTNQPRPPHSRKALQDATSDPTPPPPSLPPAHVSSSGSLTTIPTTPSRDISTTISSQDMKKWMEKGTFGDEDLKMSSELHVVCTSEQDVNRALRRRSQAQQ